MAPAPHTCSTHDTTAGVKQQERKGGKRACHTIANPGASASHHVDSRMPCEQHHAVGKATRALVRGCWTIAGMISVNRDTQTEEGGRTQKVCLCCGSWVVILDKGVFERQSQG